MAFWGLSPKDYEQQNTVRLWPDCWPAVRFFSALGSGAWNLGPNGAAGIRPEAYREVRLALGITTEQWRCIFPDLRPLEEGALEEIHKDDET
jgi:hypothetical protein